MPIVYINSPTRSDGSPYKPQNIIDATLFQAVFNSVFDGVLLLESVRNEEKIIIDFRILMSNNAIKIFSGQKELDGKYYLHVFPDTNTSGLFNLLIHVVDTGQPFDGTLYSPYDGLNNWLHIKANKFNDGCIVSCKDVTERIVAEKQLVERSDFIEKIIENIPDLIEVVDIKKDEVIYSNKIILEDLGYTSYEIKEMKISGALQLHHPDDREKIIAFRKSIREAGENEIKEYEGRVQTKDGNLLWYKLKGRVIEQDAEGVAKKYIVVWRNITEQKLNEEYFKASIDKQNKYEDQISDLTRQIESLYSERELMHRIAISEYRETYRNLYTILEFTISRDARNLTDAGKSNLRRIQSGIQKLKLLTEDLISYFEVQPAGKEAAVDLNHALKIAAQGLRNNITSTNATYISDKLPVLYGYPDLLILLFYNLLGNAIKLRSPGKKPFIKINYSLVEEKSIEHIHATTNLMYHHISFNNNGIGFNPEYAVEIFDLFFAVNEKGTFKGSGVGIPICKKIMEIHKGFITAEKPEEGATFNCYFPVLNTHSG